MAKRYLVTSGLPYSNGRLHVGHIGGAYLPADIFVRFQRARGNEVCFICGSDDNGVAIEISALQAGSTPAAVSAQYHQRQKLDFEGLRIHFDIYGGTHQPGFAAIHEKLSQRFFLRIYEKGFFTKRPQRQLFDPQAGRFLPDRYVRGICHYCGDHETYGDQCDRTGKIIDALLLKNPVSTITGQPAVVRETTHWYLRLNDFEEPLARWLESKQGQWRPHVLNFALGQVKQGLPERAMTRDIEWGIPVPLDDPDARGKVLFVWFDAPIGYISFTAALCAQRGDGEDEYLRWWANPETSIVHFIGEDNTVFHTLIWPAMLMADGRHQLPTDVVANNFLNYKVAGELRKISKSSTAADAPVWIEEYLKRHDPDALRYYLTAIAPETARTFFDPADFVARINGELVAALGNFVNRVLQFAARYFENRVPDHGTLPDADRAHLELGAHALDRVAQLIEGYRFKAAQDELMSFARACNHFFGSREPWRTRKENLPDCAAAIAACLQAARILSVLMHPFMPGAAERLRTMLGLTGPPRWEVPAPPSPGAKLGEARILFEKLEPGAMGEAAAPTEAGNG